MNKNIIEAIKTKYIIEFYYKGLLRIVEPYYYYIDVMGNEYLIGKQVEGHCESGLLGVKSFIIEEMDDINIIDENFESIHDEDLENYLQKAKIE